MNQSTAPAASAQRRRTRLWLPLLALGAVVIMMAAPLTATINGLGLLGTLLAVAAAAGFVSEVGK